MYFNGNLSKILHVYIDVKLCTNKLITWFAIIDMKILLKHTLYIFNFNFFLFLLNWYHTVKRFHIWVYWTSYYVFKYIMLLKYFIKASHSWIWLYQEFLKKYISLKSIDKTWIYNANKNRIITPFCFVIYLNLSTKTLMALPYV